MPLSNPVKPTFASVVTGTAVAASGLTGAASQSRLVGGNASGAPASGTFAVGDHVANADGTVYVCTVAGTPGTWVQVGIPGYGTPVNLDASVTSLSAGSLTTVARADHIHTLSKVPVLIASTTLGSSSSSVTFGSIPQTYSTIELIWAAKSTVAAISEYPSVRFNNDSTAKYYRWNSAAGTEYYASNIPGTTNWFTGLGWNFLVISGYTSNNHKGILSNFLWNNSGTANNISIDSTSAIYTGTSGITSITLYASFAAGSLFTLYGRP